MNQLEFFNFQNSRKTQLQEHKKDLVSSLTEEKSCVLHLVLTCLKFLIEQFNIVMAKSFLCHDKKSAVVFLLKVPLKTLEGTVLREIPDTKIFDKRGRRGGG